MLAMYVGQGVLEEQTTEHAGDRSSRNAVHPDGHLDKGQRKPAEWVASVSSILLHSGRILARKSEGRGDGDHGG